jgi:hypothetical protein
MRKFRSFVILLVVATATGCYSSVTVRPATEASTGIRYSLPATYLLVTPSANGSATYTWLYLPDTTQQYAVEADNFLTMSTLDVQTENGLLKQVGQSMDSSAVASKALSSYAALRAAEAKSKSSSKSGDDSSSSDSSTSGKSKKSQSTSSDDGSPQTTTTQETKTDETGKKKTTTTTTTTQQTSPKPQKPTSSGAIQAAYGPVLLKVVQTGNSVSLIPVSFPRLEAHGVAQEMQPQDPAIQQLFETNGATRIVTFSAKNGTSNTMSAIIAPSSAITEFDRDFPSSGVVGTDATNAAFSAKIIKADVSGTSVLVMFDKALPKGNYKISFGYRQKKSDAESLGTASLLIADPAPP